MIEFLTILFKLIIGHALADFSLQTDAMAKGKNRNRKPDYIPEGQKYMPTWYYWLSAHALIHAGAVWLITGMPILALFQFITHWIIDFVKCENWTNPHQDQFLHGIVLILTAIIAL